MYHKPTYEGRFWFFKPENLASIMDCPWSFGNPPRLGTNLAYQEGGEASVLGNSASYQANVSLIEQSFSLTWRTGDDQSPSLCQGVTGEYIIGLDLKTMSIKLKKPCRPASDNGMLLVNTSPL